MPNRILTAAKTPLRRFLRFDALDDPRNDAVLAWALFWALTAILLRFFFWWYTRRNCEDALITVLHSENFVNGLGLTHYKPGEPPLHGFTSPLSVLVPLMGDIFKVGFGLSFIKIVSAFAGGLTVLYLMAIAIHPKIRLPKPLAVIVMGYAAVEHHQVFWGMAGMETQMATLALVASLYYTIALKPASLGISLGFCMLARPDFVFWTLISGAYVLVADRRSLPRVIFVALCVYMPWIVFTTAYYGSPVPNTLLAKHYGYTNWPETPGLTWGSALMTIASRVAGGSYELNAIFQALTPCVKAHGTFYLPLFDLYGIIADIVLAFAAIGTAATLRKRRWVWLAPLGFFWVYTSYYVFFVPLVFGWYVAPLAIVTLLAGSRGLGDVAALAPYPRARSWVLSGIAAAYLASFIVYIPFTFYTQKRVQTDIEDQVRKRLGLFLQHVMEPDQTVGCEPLGYIAYYSRRPVHDFPGLASRKSVAYVRSHPKPQKFDGFLEWLHPDFIVLRFKTELEDSFKGDWLERDYRIVATFEAIPDRIKDILYVQNSVDLGFVVFAKREIADAVLTKSTEPPGINPRHSRALVTMGNRRAKQGRWEEAIEYYRKALAAAPESVAAHTVLGAALERLGHIPEAIAEYECAIDLGFRERMTDFTPQECAYAHNHLGRIVEHQGKIQEALGHYREAIRILPDYAEALVNLAAVLEKQGASSRETKELLRRALRADASRVREIFSAASVALAAQGKSEEAIQAYVNLIEMDPIARMDLAKFLVGQGKLAEAEAQYREALKQDRRNPDAYFDLGAILEATGRFEEAGDTYSKALALAPNDHEARAGLDRVNARPR